MSVMDTNKVVAAVDVGTSKVVVVIGRLNQHKQVELIGWGKSSARGLVRGEVSNIEVVADAIAEALENVDTDVVITDVYVNVSGIRYKSKNITVEHKLADGEAITKDDLFQMLSKSVEKVDLPQGVLYHMESQGFLVDGELMFSPVGTHAKKLKGSYQAFYGPDSYRKNLKEAIAKTPLRADRVVLDPIATNESVLTSEEKEVGVVLLEIGAGLTRLAIYHEGHLRYLKMMPFAGDSITIDLQHAYSISGNKARQLKEMYGHAMVEQVTKPIVVSVPEHSSERLRKVRNEHLASLIQSRLEEIAKWAEGTIEKSGFSDYLMAGVVLTGGTAELSGISTLFKYHLGMDVRIGVPRVAKPEFRELVRPRYASVVGLLKFGLLEVQDIDSEEEKRAKKATKKKTTLAESVRSGVLNLFSNVIDVSSEKTQKFFSEDEGEDMN